MKRMLLFIIIISSLFLIACGDGKATNPIKVVDGIKVGMTMSQIEEVVDLKYFQDNKSFLQVMISELEVDQNGFKYTIGDKSDDPFYGMFFFSVTTDIDVALVVFDALPNKVVAIGVIPFARAKEIAEQHSTPLWRLRE